jgi:hypothetical protein
MKSLKQKLKKENVLRIIRLLDGLRGATRRNMQIQPKILKKIIGTPNKPIKTN